MGVAVLADESVIGNLTALTDSAAFNFGLVVAQKSNDHIYVTHLAPLPLPLEEEVKEVTKKSGVSKPTSISTLVDAVIVTHAQQVIRMLPGGLDILGVYVGCPSSELGVPAHQGKLRNILSAMHKATSKYNLGVGESSLEKVVLFACTQSGKTGVKSLDLSLHGSQLSSGTLKEERANWMQMDYSYRVSMGVFIPKEAGTQNLGKTVLDFLRPWGQSLNESLLLIGGEILEEEELLDGEEDPAPPTKGRGKKTPHTRGSNSTKVLKVEILEESNPAGGCTEVQSGVHQCAGSIFFKGTVAGRAFLQGKVRASDVCSSVRADVRRSVVARWQMHADSLVEDEGDGAGGGPAWHEPPRRVFLKTGGSPVTLCDYLFPGDSVSDACQSAQELLGITVSEEDVDDTVETWADSHQFCSPGVNTPSCFTVVEGGGSVASGVANLCGGKEQCGYVWQIVVALLVAGIGVVVAYHFGFSAVKKR